MAARVLDLSLTKPQAAFALAEETYPAIVAGYRSGKSYSAFCRMLLRKIQNPKNAVAYYAPTYDLVSKIAYPGLGNLLEKHQIPYKLNKADKVMQVYGYGHFLFRTMENPAVLIGYDHGDAVVDELDVLKIDHAQEAWEKIVARNSQLKASGQPNTIAVATTPEGFKFVYERWQKDVKKGFKLYRASTWSNAHNLQPGYLDELLANFSPELVQAYVEGQFVNMAAGCVYPDFDRVLNATTAVENDNEALHIGMDFNINHMAAAVGVIRDRLPVMVGEFCNLRDTPAMIEAIKTRYGDPKKRSITIYPDASGKNGKSTDASISDILLLQRAGFHVITPEANGAVRDRIAAVNCLILASTGQRRLKVNVDKCPNLVECLEQQVYDKSGAPDKHGGKDHMNDAIGYFLVRRWPVSIGMSRMNLSGV